MTPEERDRLTTLEVKDGGRDEDIRDIKKLLIAMDKRLGSLERIAATGNGALKTTFIVGGIVSVLMNFVLSIYAVFKH